MAKPSSKTRKLDSKTSQNNKRIENCQKGLFKQSEPKFWDKWGEPIACGFIGFIFVTLIYHSWTGGKVDLGKIKVNDQTRIDYFNNNDFGFKLDHNSFFEGKTLKEVEEISNNLLAQDRKVGQCVWSPEDKTKELPEEYNFHQRHPKCKSSQQISFEGSQGYLESVSSLIEELECVNSDSSVEHYPSVTYIKLCDRNNMGEKGGAIKETLEFIKENGVVDTNCYNKLDLPEKNCPLPKDIEGCPKRTIKEFCMVNSREDIKREIFINGPVLTVIPPYFNLLTYSSGVLSLDDQTRKLSGHLTVKLVGWTKTDKGEAWLVDPMFGEEFGNDGYAAVSMEHDEEFGTFGFGVRLDKDADKVEAEQN